jgi:hypothetical protein
MEITKLGNPVFGPSIEKKSRSNLASAIVLEFMVLNENGC